MLRKVGFEFVKVDRGVIVSARENGPGRAALLAILAFAAETGALVVAEGVEDESLFRLVHEVARSEVRGRPGLIHAVQGYLLGRPGPAERVTPEVPAALAATPPQGLATDTAA
jgi:EAL domain-containing protein (putative c-di-GMP-specific phosphodiesterase class I)